MKKPQLFSIFEMPFRPLNEKVSSRIIAGEKLMFAEHRVKKGHVIKDDKHPNEQLTFVLDGHIKITVDGEIYMLKKGNALLIPSKVVHSCEVLEDSIVLEVFSPPRKEWLEK